MQTSTREKGLGHFFPFIALSATIEGNLAKYGIVVQISKEMVGLQTSTREKGVRHSLPFSLFFCSHGAVFVPHATALASSVHVLRCSETPALYDDHREHAKTHSHTCCVAQKHKRCTRTIGNMPNPKARNRAESCRVA